MKLESVEIENYRVIDELRLPLHPSLTVLHCDNAHGKTSVLSALKMADMSVLLSVRTGCSGSLFSENLFLNR